VEAVLVAAAISYLGGILHVDFHTLRVVLVSAGLEQLSLDLVLVQHLMAVQVVVGILGEPDLDPAAVEVAVPVFVLIKSEVPFF